MVPPLFTANSRWQPLRDKTLSLCCNGQSRPGLLSNKIGFSLLLRNVIRNRETVSSHRPLTLWKSDPILYCFSFTAFINNNFMQPHRILSIKTGKKLYSGSIHRFRRDFGASPMEAHFAFGAICFARCGSSMRDGSGRNRPSIRTDS